MKWLNCEKMKVLLVVFVTAIVLGGESAKGDFTFGEPVNLGSPVNSSVSDIPDYITADGLEMYLNSLNRPGGYGSYDEWITTRETIDDEWEEPVNLGQIINSSQNEGVGYMSDDGLELYLHIMGWPGGYGGFDIYVARRTTKDDAWGEPLNLGPVVNSSSWDACPWVSPDGLELYFCSNRSGGYGSDDIWISRRATRNDTWEEPTNLGSIVNSSASECWLSMSSDGLILFFSEEISKPIRPGGFGNVDMWMTRRASISDSWSIPVNLGSIVNSSRLDCRPLPSHDGSTLFFCSTRPGNLGGYYGDIYQAPIIPIVDFNGDCTLDCSDICDLLEHWGTDNSLYDIGPMPWGDGIVDMKDLEVFISYWEQQEHDTSLLAYWKLDETQGTIAYDSADCHDGTWHGGPGSFDGIDNYVSTPFVLNPAETDFGVSLWVKATSPGQTIFSQIATANWLSLDRPNGRLVVDVPSAGIGFPSQPLVADVVIADGLWHQIALVCDDMGRSVYIDGMLVATDMQTELVDCNTGFYIGCGKNREADSFFSGGIKDVKIYNRAVTP